MDKKKNENVGMSRGGEIPECWWNGGGGMAVGVALYAVGFTEGASFVQGCTGIMVNPRDTYRKRACETETIQPPVQVRRATIGRSRETDFDHKNVALSVGVDAVG